MNLRLPARYATLTPHLRRLVRARYVREQGGQCYHCKAALTGPPSAEARARSVTPALYPKGFFDYPVHLHHCHKSGFTLGAVHAHCNAVLWEHHGE